MRIIDFTISDRLSLKEFWSEGRMTEARLVETPPQDVEWPAQIQTQFKLTAEEAATLADALTLSAEEVSPDLAPSDVEDDQQLPQASTVVACEPCET